MLASWCPLNAESPAAPPSIWYTIYLCRTANVPQRTKVPVPRRLSTWLRLHICMGHHHPAIWIHFNESNTIIPSILDSSLDNYVAQKEQSRIKSEITWMRSMRFQFVFVFEMRFIFCEILNGFKGSNREFGGFSVNWFRIFSYCSIIMAIFLKI